MSANCWEMEHRQIVHVISLSKHGIHDVDSFDQPSCRKKA